MTTWWWVRHGPTHQKAFTGWRDVAADLSDQAAIDRLAAYLPANAPVVSSDLRRARETADGIAGNRPRLTDDNRLREFNFGDWDGLKFDEVAKRDPMTSRKFWESPGTVAPPNGESWNDLQARVGRAVNDLSRTVENGHIIVVAHIGVILTQIAVAGRMTAAECISHPVDPLSVTEIRYVDPPAVLQINHKP